MVARSAFYYQADMPLQSMDFYTIEASMCESHPGLALLTIPETAHRYFIDPASSIHSHDENTSFRGGINI